MLINITCVHMPLYIVYTYQPHAIITPTPSPHTLTTHFHSPHTLITHSHSPHTTLTNHTHDLTTHTLTTHSHSPHPHHSLPLTLTTHTPSPPTHHCWGRWAYHPLNVPLPHFGWLTGLLGVCLLAARSHDGCGHLGNGAVLKQDGAWSPSLTVS